MSENKESFEEWYQGDNEIPAAISMVLELANQAWNHQQQKIDRLEKANALYKKSNENIKSELEWALMTLRDELKFGLPEDQAIKRREGRARGVLITATKTLSETQKQIKKIKGEK